MFIWYIHCRPSPFHPGGWQVALSERPSIALPKCNESILLIPGTIPLDEAFS